MRSSLSKITPISFWRKKKIFQVAFPSTERWKKKLINVSSTEHSKLLDPVLNTILWLEKAEEFGTRVVC